MANDRKSADPDGAKHLLVTALENLAADADAQIANLSAGEGPWTIDDLGLDFDHAVYAAGDAKILSPAQLAELQAILAELKRISGKANEDLWTESALHLAPQWRRIRGLARQALKDL